MKLLPMLLIVGACSLGRCNQPVYAPSTPHSQPPTLNPQLPTANPKPPPPVARLTAGQVVATATLVHADTERGISVTAWSAVAGQEAITLDFPDGSRYAATMIAHHRDWGIAFLGHGNPVGIAPAAIATTPPAQGDTVFVAGYAGYGGSSFEAEPTTVIGFVPPAVPPAPADSPPHCMALRAKGLSPGSPVSNPSGLLVGVVVTEDQHYSYAPQATVLRFFLQETLASLDPAQLPLPGPSDGAGGELAGGAEPAPVEAGPAAAPVAPAVSAGSDLSMERPADRGGGFGAKTAVAIGKLIPTALEIAAIIAALASGGGAAYVGWRGLAFALAKFGLGAAKKRLGTLGTKDPSPPFLARDTTAGEQLVELAQRQGESPVLDAIVGRLALDGLDEIIDSEPVRPEQPFAKEFKRELFERFNDVAPVVTRPS